MIVVATSRGVPRACAAGNNAVRGLAIVDAEARSGTASADAKSRRLSCFSAKSRL
jgi:hypothetical protein